MGCCSLSRLAGPPREIRILMLGLDNAGKTTILYNRKLGSRGEIVPTYGFNIETVEWDDIQLTIWDVGGSDKIRELWWHYYQQTDAVIFVIDSTDHQRIGCLSQYKSKLLNYCYGCS